MVVLSNYVQIFVGLIIYDIKKTRSLTKACQKHDFWLVNFGYRVVGVPKLCQNIFQLNI